jgi:hypothetical protein
MHRLRGVRGRVLVVNREPGALLEVRGRARRHELGGVMGATNTVPIGSTEAENTRRTLESAFKEGYEAGLASSRNIEAERLRIAQMADEWGLHQFAAALRQ